MNHVSGGDWGVVVSTTTATIPSSRGSEAVARYAADYGLSRSGARASLGKYLKTVWQRRHFILSLARAKADADNAKSRLGWVWDVLTPLLNAAVYYLVFGVLLAKGGGVVSTPDYICFLIIGVFLFGYTSRSLTAGVKSIYTNLGMIRALHFPRLSLPLAAVLTELRQMTLTIVVMVAILLGFGKKPHWTWLLLPVVMFLQTLFNLGLALILARVGAESSDFGQLLPFLVRTWMYLSGVMFSIDYRLSQSKHAVSPIVGDILRNNPASLFLSLARGVLIGDPYTQVYSTRHWLMRHGVDWAITAGWSVGLLVIGFFVFWTAEEKYGRG